MRFRLLLLCSLLLSVSASAQIPGAAEDLVEIDSIQARLRKSFETFTEIRPAQRREARAAAAVTRALGYSYAEVYDLGFIVLAATSLPPTAPEVKWLKFYGGVRAVSMWSDALQTQLAVLRENRGAFRSAATRRALADGIVEVERLQALARRLGERWPPEWRQ